MVPALRRPALRIVATYAFVASLWIGISDAAVGFLSNEIRTVAHLGLLKGLFFVAVTSFALFILLQRHLARLRAITEHAARRERMQRLGEVAATIAHDFNNVLMTTRTFAAVLGRVAGDTGTNTAVEHIMRAVERGESLTREILTYATPHTPVLTPIALVPFLESLTAELRSLMPTMTVRLRVSDATVSVLGDANLLHRLLMNLATNARDAMGDSGTLTIAACTAPRSDPSRGARVIQATRITVADTGPGIPPETAARIFEPQFTTKRTGTGLGLAIVQRIVTDLGGDIDVQTEIGTGTTIVITLPTPP